MPTQRRAQTLTRWKQAARKNSFNLAANGAGAFHFAIIASAFNRPLTLSLVDGARRFLERHGATAAQISVLWAPGAFELPVVAARVAGRPNHPDAIIALGVLIRGQTSQYAVIAQAVAQGLTEVSVRTGVPVSFGVIVAETLEQARARAGGKAGNRGEEAAEAAVAVLSTLRAIS